MSRGTVPDPALGLALAEDRSGVSSRISAYHRDGGSDERARPRGASASVRRARGVARVYYGANKM